MKQFLFGLTALITLSLLIVVGCKKSDSSGGDSSVPQNVTAYLSGTSVIVTWTEVEGADRYKVYRASSSDGEYSSLNLTYNTSYTDNNPMSNNYYKITAINEEGEESGFSAVAYCEYSSGGGGGGGGTTTLDPPTNVNASVNGSSVSVSWSEVSAADYYKIYRASSSYNTYSYLGQSYYTSYTDNNPLNGYNYYKVSSVNSDGEESEKSNSAYCNYSGGGGGGGTTTPPSAPTGLSANNEGTTSVPNVKISWNSVSDATSYKVYRSTSANGSYSQIGSEVSWTYLYDSNPNNGNNYYKVKAFNSAGSSSYSDYVLFEFDANGYSPCPPTINGSVSGYNITLRWSFPSSHGCGTPSSIKVEVYNNSTGQVENVSGTLSGTATSHTFYCNFPIYANDYNWIEMRVVGENSHGSDKRTIKYNYQTNQWMGGN